MKKRYLGIALASLFSISLVSCGQGSNDGGNSPELDDDGQTIELKIDPSENYTYEEVDNSKGSVSYEIFVRSFYDSDGNGIGDFNGITQQLDYLQTLGVSNLWLMPINPSPSYHGYDVRDYYQVNPDFGNMNDFKNLVKEAKNHGITIMIDMVLNHTSTQHPWFQQSANDYRNNNHSSNSKADWYVWRDTHLDGYNNWGGKYYESRFSGSMPDLNTKCPAVRQEIDHILKYWIDLGVKGFRLDAVKYFEYEDTAYNTEFLTFLKETAAKYADDISFVGECWDDREVVLQYANSKIDSFFNFSSSIGGSFEESVLSVSNAHNPAAIFAENIQDYESRLKENNPNGYSSYFLSNHDMDRARDFMVEEKKFQTISTYLLMPGTPYIYYGEEIEMKGTRQEGDNTDVRRRLPMIWSANDNTGKCRFPEHGKEHLDIQVQVREGVYDQLETNYSVLNHYRKVINVRNKYPFFKNAEFKNLVPNLKTDNEYVLAYMLVKDRNTAIIIHNYNEENIEVDLPAKGYHIADSISNRRLIPEINGNKIRIGGYSSVILTK